MQLQYGVEVQHFLALIARSVGIRFPEIFKELRLLDDVDVALERVRPRVRELGYDEAEVRKYISQVIYM